MRRKRATGMLNPFIAWSEVALRTAEMMTASGQVIAQRTSRLAKHPQHYTGRDYREMTRMTHEKAAAAVESGMAMAAELASLNWQLASGGLWSALAAWNRTGRTAARPGSMSSLYQPMDWTRTLLDLGAASSGLARDSARVASRGLRPIHSRATANARRLGRTPRK